MLLKGDSFGKEIDDKGCQEDTSHELQLLQEDAKQAE